MNDQYDGHRKDRRPDVTGEGLCDVCGFLFSSPLEYMSPEVFS